jgi:RNA polymerase sigma factor (sigma-70 family)
VKTSLEKYSDEELISLYKKGEGNESVGILFKRYTHLVYGVCMKYLKDEDESKDAVSQIFEKLLTDLKKHEIQFFKGWLHTVVKNHCYMQMRKKPKEISKVAPNVMETDIGLHLDASTTEEKQEEELKLQHMEQALKQLDPHQQQCIQLFYLEQKCYQEVATLTGFTMNQVKSYIQNGKRNLKIIMLKNE